MTDIVPMPPATDAFALAEKICRSPLMPEAYRGKPIDAAIAMLYGQEIGLPPMTSLQRIVVIKGKPTLDAQGIVARIRQRGHNLSGMSNATGAEVTGKRYDTGDEMTVTFTIEDARTAGLTGSDGYKKYPADMLWARAVSRIGRRLFGDVLMGVSYTPEEMRSVVGVIDVDEITDDDTGVLADAVDVEAILTALNAVVGVADRKRLKKEFLDRFGRPESLLLTQVEEAMEWVAHACFGEDDDTPEAAADEAGNAATEQGALDGFSGEAFT